MKNSEVLMWKYVEPSQGSPFFDCFSTGFTCGYFSLSLSGI